MVKPAKVETVKGIRADYESVAKSGGMLVFAQFDGVTVAQMSKLRRNLGAKSVKLRVLKNTLLRKALEESGVTGAESYLKGTTAVAFSPDEVSAPKVLAAFAKEIEALKKASKLVIKGGVLEGKAVTAKEVAVLATLPSREEVMATLLALINTPAVNLLRLIKEPACRAARVIKAAGEKKGA